MSGREGVGGSVQSTEARRACKVRAAQAVPQELVALLWESGLNGLLVGCGDGGCGGAGRGGWERAGLSALTTSYPSSQCPVLCLH